MANATYRPTTPIDTTAKNTTGTGAPPMSTLTRAGSVSTTATMAEGTTPYTGTLLALSLDQYSPPGTVAAEREQHPGGCHRPTRRCIGRGRDRARTPRQRGAPDRVGGPRHVSRRRTGSPLRRYGQQLVGRAGAVAPDQQAPAVRAGDLGDRFGEHGDVVARGGRP